MLANRRMPKTRCLMHNPSNSIASNIGLMTIAIGQARSMEGIWLAKKPKRTELPDAAHDARREGDEGQGRRHAERSGRRAHPRQQAAQIADQDEHEHGPQQRDELVAVVGANRRPGNIVPDVDQEDFQQIRQRSPRRPARGDASGQPGEDHQQHQGHGDFDDQELGYAEARFRLVKIPQLAEGLRNQDSCRSDAGCTPRFSPATIPAAAACTRRHRPPAA